MIPLVMSVIAKTETFQRDMARARGHVGKFESQIRKSNITMTGFSRSILRLAGIGGGLYLLQRGFRGTIAATVEQEKAENQLRASIGNNIETMKKYAAGLQKLTIYGDEQIMSQMAYGANLGITTDKLQAATKAAIGLAAKYRLDLSASMMLVGRASMGQTQMLTRYGIVLDETLKPQEKFDELLRLGEKSFYLAKKQTEDAAGAYAQFGNMAGDLAEQLGGPLLESLSNVMRELVKHSDVWAEFFKVQSEGWAEILSGFESTRTIINELSKKVPEGSKYYGVGGFGGGIMGVPQTKTTERIPIGTLDISPRGYQKLAEMRERLAEMELEAQRKAFVGPPMPSIPEFVGPPKPSLADLQEGLKEVDKANYDIAQAYVRMYDAIDDRSKKSFEWKKKLIEAEYKIYEQNVTDTVLLEELKTERLNQLAIEQAKQSQDAIAGVGAAIYDMQKELPTIGGLFYDLTKTGVGGLVDGLNDALWKTKDLNEAMKELGRTMAMMATKWLIQQAMMGVLSPLSGIGIPTLVGHSGGRVGSLKERRWVSPEVFSGAPRYHDLKPGESAIIAQEDEVISRPGKSGGSNIETLLGDIVSLLKQRQTINANIIDKRDIVTKERIESREGEQWTMRHIRRNG